MRRGQVVSDRFEIQEQIDEGGMGTVYRALDRTLGQPVAVKVLHKVGPSDTERFSREAVVLRALSHPSIVRYVEHGMTEVGERFLVMEWVAGETLSARLKRQGLTVRESVGMARSVAEALHVMHRLGLVHRDIKPQNLIFPEGERDRVKLIDFGIARRVQESMGLTQVGTMVGSMGYMAPEQARGLGQIDARADVFALGVVLYECLTGEPAFAGPDLLSVRTKILLTHPPPVRRYNPDVSDQLELLVSQMLAKVPEDRPVDATEVASRLAALDEQEGLPIQALTRRVETARLTAATLDSRPVSAPRALTCIIMVGSDGMEDEEEERSRRDASGVRATVAPFSAKVDVLDDGWMVVTLSGDREPTELTTNAARCALELRALFPDVPIALSAQEATGEDLDQLIDRSVESVLKESLDAALLSSGRHPGPEAIKLDKEVARYLGDDFRIFRGPAGAYLVG